MADSGLKKVAVQLVTTIDNSQAEKQVKDAAKAAQNAAEKNPVDLSVDVNVDTIIAKFKQIDEEFTQLQRNIADMTGAFRSDKKIAGFTNVQTSLKDIGLYLETIKDAVVKSPLFSGAAASNAEEVVDIFAKTDDKAKAAADSINQAAGAMDNFNNAGGKGGDKKSSTLKTLQEIQTLISKIVNANGWNNDLASLTLDDKKITHAVGAFDNLFKTLKAGKTSVKSLQEAQDFINNFNGKNYTTIFNTGSADGIPKVSQLVRNLTKDLISGNDALKDFNFESFSNIDVEKKLEVAKNIFKDFNRTITLPDGTVKTYRELAEILVEIPSDSTSINEKSQADFETLKQLVELEKEYNTENAKVKQKSGLNIDISSESINKLSEAIGQIKAVVGEGNTIGFSDESLKQFQATIGTISEAIKALHAALSQKFDIPLPEGFEKIAGTEEERGNMQTLSSAVEDVTTAVLSKTDAFRDEMAVVSSVASTEEADLIKVEEAVRRITAAITECVKEFAQFDFDGAKINVPTETIDVINDVQEAYQRFNTDGTQLHITIPQSFIDALDEVQVAINEINRYAVRLNIEIPPEAQTILNNVKELIKTFNSNKLNINVKTGENGEKVIQSMIELTKAGRKGLNPNEYSSLFSNISKIKDDTATAFYLIAGSIEKIVNSFNSLNDNGNGFLTQINNLASYGDTLNDLAIILKTAPVRIEEVQNAIAKSVNKKQNKVDLTDVPQKQVDAWRNKYGGSIGDIVGIERQYKKSKDGLEPVHILTGASGRKVPVNENGIVSGTFDVNKDITQQYKSVTDAYTKISKSIDEYIGKSKKAGDASSDLSLILGDLKSSVNGAKDSFESGKTYLSDYKDTIINGSTDDKGNKHASKTDETKFVGDLVDTRVKLESAASEYKSAKDALNNAEASFNKKTTEETAGAYKDATDAFNAASAKYEEVIQKYRDLLSSDNAKTFISQDVLDRLNKDVSSVNTDVSRYNGTQKSLGKIADSRIQPNTNEKDYKEVSKLLDDVIKKQKALNAEVVKEKTARSDANKQAKEYAQNEYNAAKQKYEDAINAYQQPGLDETNGGLSSQQISNLTSKYNASQQTSTAVIKADIKLFQDASDAAFEYYNLKAKQASEDGLNAEEASELEKLQKLWDYATAAKKEYADVNVVSISSDLNKAYTEFSNRSVSGYMSGLQEYIGSMSGKVSTAQNNKRNLPYVAEYFDQIQQLKDAYEELQKIAENGVGDGVAFDNAQKRVYELKTSIEGLFEEIKKGKNSDTMIVADQGEISKYLANIEKIKTQNDAMSSEMMSKWTALGKRFQEAMDTKATIADVKVLEDEFERLNYELQASGQTGKSFFTSIKEHLTSINAQFAAQFLSIQDWIRYLRTAASTVIEIDTALTELRKVTNDITDARLNESLIASTNTAKELGQTISEVVNATADWSRLGYNIDDSEILARVTALYKNVGDDMTMDTASESLISTLKGFQMDASEAESIVDKFNEVANNYAIDTAGIGEALQVSAASFNTAHTSLDESIALITATNAVVQDPSKVGNMWKTVSARLRGAKAELEEMGEDTEGMVESTSTLRSLVKGMTGFDIMKNEKEFKSIYEIVVGIGEKWQDLNDVDKAALLEKLAGKVQSNSLAAALQNYKEIESIYNTSANESEGSTEREQENYEKSVQYSIDKFKASLQELANEAIDSGTLKGIVDFGTQLLSLLDKIIDKIGILGTALSALSIGGSALKGKDFGLNRKDGLWTLFGYKLTAKDEKLSEDAFSSLMSDISDNPIISDASGKTLDTQKTLTKMLERDLVPTYEEYSAAVDKTNSSILSLSGSEALTAIQSKALGVALNVGVSLAISAAISLITSFITSNERLRESIAKAENEFQSSSKNIDEYAQRIEELHKTISDNNASYEDQYNARRELSTIQDELISKYGKEAESINAVTEAIRQANDANAEMVSGSLDALKQKEWTYAKNDVNHSDGIFNKIADYFMNLNRGTDNNSDRFVSMMENYSSTFSLANSNAEFNEFLSGLNGVNVYDGMAEVRGTAEDVLNTLTEITAEADRLNVYTGDLNNELYKARDFYDTQIDYYKETVKYDRILQNDDWTEDLNNYDSLYDSYQDSIASGDNAKIEESKTALFDAIVDGANEAGEQGANDVAEYFIEMYPELEQAIRNWKFKASIEVVPEDGSKSNAQQIKDMFAGNVFQSEEQFRDAFNYKNGDWTPAQEAAVAKAHEIVNDNKISVDELIEDAQGYDLIPSEAFADAESRINEFKKNLNSTDEGYEKESEAVDKLTEMLDKADKQEAMTMYNTMKNCRSATEAIKKMNETLADTAEALDLASLNEKISGLEGIFDKYNDDQELSIEDVGSMLEANPEYIKYLTKVGDQYKINAQAVEEYNQLEEERKKNIDMRFGDVSYVSDYNSLLDDVSSDRNHQYQVYKNGEKQEIDGVVASIKNVNTSLAEGKIKIADYLNSITQAMAQLRSLGDDVDSSTEYQQNLIAATSEMISNVVVSAQDAFTTGNMTAQDYLESQIASAKATLTEMEKVGNITAHKNVEGDTYYGGDGAESANALLNATENLEAMDEIFGAISEHAEYIEENIEGVGTAIEDVSKDSEFTSLADDLLGGFQAYAQEMPNEFSNISSQIADALNMSVSQVNELMSQGGEEAKKAWLEAFQNTGDPTGAMQEMTDIAKSAVADGAEEMNDNLSTAFDDLEQAIQNVDATLSVTPENNSPSGYVRVLENGDIVSSLPEFKWKLSGSSSGVSALGSALSNVRSAMASTGKSAISLLGDTSSYMQPGTVNTSKPATTIPGNTGSSSGGGGSSDATDARNDAYQKERDVLDALHEEGKVTEKQYLDQLRKLYEEFYGDVEGYAEEYEKYQREYLEGIKDLYDSALDFIISKISNQISKLNDAKDAAVSALEAERDSAKAPLEARKKELEAEKKALQKQQKALQKRMDALQDEIDAINEAAEARERQMTLEEAYYNLMKAENQRTSLVYKAGSGFTYETNQSDITSARDEVDDAEREQKIAGIQAEIDKLQDEYDAIQDQIDEIDEELESIEEEMEAIDDYYDQLIKDTEAYYDEQIKKLQETQDELQSLKDMMDMAEAYAKYKDVFEDANVTVQQLIDGDKDAIARFKEAFIGVYNDLYEANANWQSALQSEVPGTTGLESYLKQTEEYIGNLNKIDLSSFENALKSIETGVLNVNTAAQTPLDTTKYEALAKSSESIATNSQNATTGITALNTAVAGLSTVNTEGFATAATDLQNFADYSEKAVLALTNLNTALNDDQSTTLGVNIAAVATGFSSLGQAIAETATAIGGGSTDTGDFSLQGTGIESSGGEGEGEEGSGGGMTGSLVSAIENLAVVAQDEEIGIPAIVRQFAGGMTGGDGEGGEGGEGHGNGGEASADSLAGAATLVKEIIGTEDDDSSTDTLIGSFIAVEKTAESQLPPVIDYFNQLLDVLNQIKEVLDGIISDLTSLGALDLSAGKWGGFIARNGGYIPTYSIGGPISHRKNPLDELAEAVGEDHMVAVREGEYILTKNDVERAKAGATLDEIIYDHDVRRKRIGITGHATGGFITNKDESPLDWLAEAKGEDHMVAVTEGEYVLSKDELKALGASKFTNLTQSQATKYSALNASQLSGSPTKSGALLSSIASGLQSSVGSISNSQTTGDYSQNFTMGNIYLSEVNDVDSLSKAIVQKMPSMVMQKVYAR